MGAPPSLSSCAGVLSCGSVVVGIFVQMFLHMRMCVLMVTDHCRGPFQKIFFFVNCLVHNGSILVTKIMASLTGART